ncbi:MAG: bifunctional phosphopantothenoylcysteine decarboxylase/phosphopantothenate--cysteine ligase CoaBC [Anaerolineaceae bacterium]|nr:MAG: bifunctional phosphopantothenoylcysteine decarboxylase/phosphopantothenate--cysteine ligase CoaBC [Anaerolineaceae bacterium]
MPILAGKRIVLGVTGSIACYKAVDLASKLTQAGAAVDVILSNAAGRFVTPLTFQAVTGRAVYTDLWGATGDDSGGLPTHIAHVGLGESADIYAIIPATANTLSKLAHGASDDLISITALSAPCPLIVAPAMDGSMYDHPATQANIRTLTERGAYLIPPDTGRFASGMVGLGRLPETPTLIGHLRRVVGREGALQGRKVVVSAGGTREPLDPVRYIGNRSSGKQGHAIAQSAIDAGAREVILVTSSDLPTPVGVVRVPVERAEEMEAALVAHCADADLLVMVAAVADFRPSRYAERKIKKETDAPPVIELAANNDILLTLKAERGRHGFPRVVVGFAAESDDLLLHAADKRQRKGLDLLVANDITATDAGFSVDDNRVSILDAAGNVQALDLMSKAEVADQVIERASALLS